MAGRAPFLSEAISRYIAEHAVREAPVLRELREATASVKWSGMQIGADQGQLMAILVKLMGAKRCLEIGTYTGYSALAVALALPKDGRIVCCDVSEEFTNVGKPFWKKAKVEKKIDLRIGPALETLKTLKGPFDFVFIDADKPGNPHYFQWALKLTRSGSVIIVDNVVRRGQVIDPDTSDANVRGVRRFNEKLAGLTQVSATTLQTVGSKGYDGFTLAIVKGA
jgi:O-methyltransferase